MARPQRFFRLDGAPADRALPEELTLEVFSPSPWRLRGPEAEERPPFLLYLFWYLAGAGGYRVYYAMAEGRAVHVSHVLGRSFKFPFMARRDLHIGPCWTAADFRGRGIFPAVLSRIARDHEGRRLWMLTDEENVSSQRGILKAGFRFVGTGVRSRGIYRMTKAADQAR